MRTRSLVLMVSLFAAACATTSGEEASDRNEPRRAPVRERKTAPYEDGEVELPVDTQLVVRLRPGRFDALAPLMRPLERAARMLDTANSVFVDIRWSKALRKLATLPPGGILRLLPQFIVDGAENEPENLLQAYGRGLVIEGNALEATELAPLAADRPTLLAVSFARHREEIRNQRLGAPPPRVPEPPDWIRVRAVLPSSDPAALADALRSQCDDLELPYFDGPAPGSKACGVVANVEIREASVVADLFYSEQWQQTKGDTPSLRSADRRLAERTPRLRTTSALRAFAALDGPVGLYMSAEFPRLLTGVTSASEHRGSFSTGWFARLALVARSPAREFEDLSFTVESVGDDGVRADLVRSYTELGRRIDRTALGTVDLPRVRVPGEVVRAESGWNGVRAAAAAKLPDWVRRCRETPVQQGDSPVHPEEPGSGFLEYYWHTASPAARLHAYLAYPAALTRASSLFANDEPWALRWNHHYPVSWRGALDTWRAQSHHPKSLVGGFQFQYAQGVPAVVRDTIDGLGKELDGFDMRSSTVGDRLAIRFGHQRWIEKSDIWRPSDTGSRDDPPPTSMRIDLATLSKVLSCDERRKEESDEATTDGEMSKTAEAGEASDPADGVVDRICRLAEGLEGLQFGTRRNASAHRVQLQLGPLGNRKRPPPPPESDVAPKPAPTVPACYSRIVWTTRHDLAAHRTRSTRGSGAERRVSDMAGEVRRRRRKCAVKGRLADDLRRLEAEWWRYAAAENLGYLDFEGAADMVRRSCESATTDTCRWRRDLEETSVPIVPVVHDHLGEGFSTDPTDPLLTTDALYIAGKRFPNLYDANDSRWREEVERLVRRGSDRDFPVAHSTRQAMRRGRPGSDNETVRARLLVADPAVPMSKIDRFVGLLRDSSKATHVAFPVRRRGLSTNRSDRFGVLLASWSPDESARLRIRVKSSGYAVAVDGRQLFSGGDCSGGLTVCEGDAAAALHRRLVEVADAKPDLERATVIVGPDVTFRRIARTLAATAYRTEGEYPTPEMKLDAPPTVTGELISSADLRMAPRSTEADGGE